MTRRVEPARHPLFNLHQLVDHEVLSRRDPFDPTHGVRIQLQRPELFMLVDAELVEAVSKYRWHLTPKGYARHSHRRPGGHQNGVQPIMLHRVLFGAAPRQFVDHRNGSRADNRRCNLRACSPLENSRHVTSSKLQKRGGYKGVRFIEKDRCWRAFIGAGPIQANGKHRNITLGQFDTAEAAARAYDAAALAAFGEFAATNFPQGSAALARSA